MMHATAPVLWPPRPKMVIGKDLRLIARDKLTKPTNLTNEFKLKPKRSIMMRRLLLTNFLRRRLNSNKREPRKLSRLKRKLIKRRTKLMSQRPKKNWTLLKRTNNFFNNNNSSSRSNKRLLARLMFPLGSSKNLSPF
jgi:hypothetical protein